MKFMKRDRAFEIVLELARQNIHESDPEQIQACDVVEDFYVKYIADKFS